ncbi:hypothetical protein DPMN_006067 [Dreissena polymorpha]|uniref:Uncharacterized protein n=1 Tax=Dreissena polymorpha TaxID=45954 RepID=A0A9D4RUI5_DREPO|nr:hypothetical protein DPMN_006067 [Dreissena polymorpha]
MFKQQGSTLRHVRQTLSIKLRANLSDCDSAAEMESKPNTGPVEVTVQQKCNCGSDCGWKTAEMELKPDTGPQLTFLPFSCQSCQRYRDLCLLTRHSSATL